MDLHSIRIHVRLSPTHRNLSFHWTKDELVVHHDTDQGRGQRLRLKSHHIPHEHVLRVKYDAEKSTLSIAYLKANPKKNNSRSLVVLSGVVKDKEKGEAETWAQETMKQLYDDRGIKPFRHLLVFVNPHGGSGKAEKIWTKDVEPVLHAAGCTIKLIRTERHGHAFDVVKSMDLEYDAIVTVSGDGLVHEVINGLAERPSDPVKALTIPIAPVPAGSGNGLALNLLGLQYGFDAVTAAANVIKGRPMPIDLFSITQGGKRSLSFMSQALGIMADLDLGTEHLRWMGDARFMYGFFRGIVNLRPCPIQLSIKVAQKDKQRMAEALEEAYNNGTPLVRQNSRDQSSSSLPPLKHLPDDNSEDWITLEDPLLFVYAGQGPYVGRDYMAFPVSLPNDGLIDISALSLTNRKDLLSTISAAPTGETFWMSQLQYYKAEAYRVKPMAGSGNLSIDGERFPFEQYQVEVHPSLGTLLSCHGRFIADFNTRKPQT